MSACGSRSRPGCGRDIVWGILPDGRKVPLDTSAPVYKIGVWDGELKAYAIERVPGYKAGHHACCPQVNNFRKEKPKDQASRPVGEPARATGRDRAAGD